MVDILIIRNRCDKATELTNRIGDGLKAYLERKGFSVTDLSDAAASPENVSYWLDFSAKRVTKAVIALDHGSCSAFYGEKNGKLAKVIDKNNVSNLTKNIHIYTLACSTNGDNCVGKTAVEVAGCLSWLGYTEPVYVVEHQDFTNCIWSYIQAMAEGKTIEDCEKALISNYESRYWLHFAFKHNRDRLKLRERKRDMTIKSDNRDGLDWALCEVKAAGPGEFGKMNILLMEKNKAFEKWFYVDPNIAQNALFVALAAIKNKKIVEVEYVGDKIMTFNKAMN